MTRGQQLSADHLGQLDSFTIPAPARSDLYFRTLLDNLPAGAYTCDDQGLITYYNERAVEVWGRAPALNNPIDRFCGSFKLFAADGSPLQHEQCWMGLAILQQKAFTGEEIIVEQPNGRRLTVLAHASPIHDESGQLIGAVNVLVDITERKRAELELREKNALLASIHKASISVSSELDLQKLVQVITDIGVEVTKAQFGAFFYNEVGDEGEIYTLFTLSGTDKDAFSKFPMPRNTHVFGPTFRGEGVVRSADITGDPRYGKNPPYRGMPDGHLPVRSYLAVPVVSRSDEVLGGLFFGHHEVGVFDDQAERLITGIASQAAVAIDNARLYEQALSLNHSLDEKVKSRTAELQILNNELEAFNYSVSHDLRSPLRAMSGFSTTLLSDYGDQLDEEARYYLQRINLGTLRMSDLIDSLLQLSRLTRAKVLRVELELAPLVDGIVRDLREREPERRISVEVDDGLTISGDQTLLRIALENLLGNAWKFTRNRDSALIAVGAEERDGETVYFVKDDGVGFDMKYIDKLFKAFQRLHRVDEFEGIGIGLATVQRVINRHGGRIWAESEPEQGASFYFTLNG
ncbi:MAG: ATP-binding protein [Trueperaceae bacterium]